MSLRLFLSVLLFVVGTSSVQGLDVRVDDPAVFIEAEEQLLSVVLARVGELTGASVEVSPKVERPVSLSVRGLPLQQAMDSIARQYGLNIVLGWRRDSEGRSHLVSIDVLPDGNMDHSALAEEDATRRRVLNQQRSNRPGRAIPGGGENRSWWHNRNRETDD